MWKWLRFIGGCAETMTGASFGSAGGPIGTVVGAIIGGFVGSKGGEKAKSCWPKSL